MLGEQPRSPARWVVRKRRRQTAKSVAMARPCGDGRDDVAGSLLDAGGDVRVGLGGQPQVVGGVAQRRMTHVGLQDRQQRADVLAAERTRPQIVDREGVPQVVDAGTVAPPAVGDAGLPEEPAEVLVDVPDRQRQAGPAGEEPVPGRTPGDVGRGSRRA